ncbi:hypothetical protein AA103587_1249 [Gluconobacter kanchanaburiensis NBRC 103587]|nr:hypothetical protein AA103587_1249 [Gluconobacter kanchanaburiensis NBRC 103587]
MEMEAPTSMAITVAVAVMAVMSASGSGETAITVPEDAAGRSITGVTIGGCMPHRAAITGCVMETSFC